MNEQPKDHGPPKLTTMEDQHEFDVAKFMPRNRDYNTSLPEDWEPTPHSVVIGRGKSRTNNEGNQKLQSICQTYLEKYSNATSKLEKTTMVSRIVETVQDACPKGAFVKFVKGRYWEVDDHCGKSSLLSCQRVAHVKLAYSFLTHKSLNFLCATAAREKVGYVMRDLLHDKYKSSSKSKVAPRRSQRSQKRLKCPSRSSSASSGDYSSAASIPQDPSQTPSILQGELPVSISFPPFNNHQVQSNGNTNDANDATVLGSETASVSNSSFMMRNTVTPLMNLSHSSIVGGGEHNVSFLSGNPSAPIFGSQTLQQRQLLLSRHQLMGGFDSHQQQMSQGQQLLLQGMLPQTEFGMMSPQLMMHQATADQVNNIGQQGRIHPRFLQTGEINSLAVSQQQSHQGRNNNHQQWQPNVLSSANSSTVPTSNATSRQGHTDGGAQSVNGILGNQQSSSDGRMVIDNEAAAIAAVQQIVIRNASDDLNNEDFTNIFDG